MESPVAALSPAPKAPVPAARTAPDSPSFALLLSLFTSTILSGALLLFLVQPMIAKMVLPRLGGSPSVWITCMLFFQALLLAGYAYAHLLANHLPVRLQVAVHAAVVAAIRPAANSHFVLRISTSVGTARSRGLTHATGYAPGGGSVPTKSIFRHSWRRATSPNRVFLPAAVWPGWATAPLAPAPSSAWH